MAGTWYEISTAEAVQRGSTYGRVAVRVIAASRREAWEMARYLIPGNVACELTEASQAAGR